MSPRALTLLALLPWSPAPVRAEDDAPDEVIVVEDQAVVRARQELGFALRELGYERKRVRDGREIYANEDPWKPQVVVDDDGWMIVRRAPPSFSKPELPGIWSGPLGYLVCLANPFACIHIGGLIVSERKLAWQKHAVVEHTEGAMRRYDAAIVARALQARMGEELPDQLAALWERGERPEGGALLASPEERRAALLELWATRTCNEWGDAAREVVRRFVQYEVQPGPTPVTAEELRAANARRSCDQALVIEDLP